MDPTAIRGFRKLCFSTLTAVYVLILVGGIVRTTGSGMGCPDWPRCFGKWAPPVSADQLPENYKAVYAASREKKNLKFAKYLRVFGLGGTADELLTDKAVQTETDFNVTKAWIEYANRIVGVVIGFMILAMFVRSWKLRATHRPIFLLSLATLLSVILQGWFGSIVVATNLTTWTITVHMFLALLIVAFIVRLLVLSGEALRQADGMPGRFLLVLCMAGLLIQIVLGTRVRAVIDVIANHLPRTAWAGALGRPFVLHRAFSILVVGLHLILLLKLGKTMGSKALPRALIVIILGVLLTGAGMAWLDVPAVLQPLHLVLATGAFGLQLYLFFQWDPRRKFVLTN